MGKCEPDTLITVFRIGALFMIDIFLNSEARLELHVRVGYEKEKELPGCIVHGRHLIAKADLIEYIIEHDDEERRQIQDGHR